MVTILHSSSVCYHTHSCPTYIYPWRLNPDHPLSPPPMYFYFFPSFIFISPLLIASILPTFNLFIITLYVCLVLPFSFFRHFLPSSLFLFLCFFLSFLFLSLFLPFFFFFPLVLSFLLLHLLSSIPFIFLVFSLSSDLNICPLVSYRLFESPFL